MVKNFVSFCIFGCFSAFSYGGGFVDVTVMSADVILERTNEKTPRIVDETNKAQVKVTVDNSDGIFSVSSKGLRNSISNAGQIHIFVPKGYRVRAKAIELGQRV